MTSNIDALVHKYMGILRVDGRPPIVQIRSRLGAGWLGRDMWSSRSPDTTTMELQRSVLGDPRTLERVVAHEMIHHRDFLAMSEQTREMVKFGLRPEGHGAEFLQGAALINAVMGHGFVTVTSDREYVRAPLGRDLFLLIVPTHNRLGYAWAARLSPEAQEIIREKTAQGARLVRTREERWTAGKAKIRKYGGVSIPLTGTPEEAALRQLFEQAGA